MMIMVAMSLLCLLTISSYASSSTLYPCQLIGKFFTSADNDGVVSLQELLGHPVAFFPTPIQSVYKVSMLIIFILKTIS